MTNCLSYMLSGTDKVGENKMWLIIGFAVFLILVILAMEGTLA